MALDFPNSPTNGQTYGNYYFDSSVGTSGAWRANPIPVGGLPAGSIIQWGSNTAPSNWLICDGSAVSRTVYPSLFAAIGTQYGAGDGSTTFNLPDLRGRVAVGKNGGTFGTLGATGGEETHLLTSAESGLVDHSHYLPMAASGAPSNTTDVPLRASGAADFAFRTGTTKSTPSYNSADISKNASQAHNNLQPYIVTNYIIKATSGWSAGDSELATRVGALEAAPAGLVRVVPTSVAVGSGSASVSATGVVTFSGASSVSLNECFSSSFTRYRVVIDQGGSAPDIPMRYRYRVGTTDQSAASYNHGGYVCYQQGTSAFGGGAGQTSQYIGINNALGVGPSTTIMDVSRYSYATAAINTTGGYSAYGIGSWTLNAKAYLTDITGITFFGDSGTFTGIIQVYGYRN